MIHFFMEHLRLITSKFPWFIIKKYFVVFQHTFIRYSRCSQYSLSAVLIKQSLLKDIHMKEA